MAVENEVTVATVALREDRKGATHERPQPAVAFRSNGGAQFGLAGLPQGLRSVMVGVAALTRLAARRAGEVVMERRLWREASFDLTGGTVRDLRRA